MFGGISKTTETCLLIFDRVTAAGPEVVALLRDSKSAFPASCPLNQYSKLVRICQSCGDQPDRLRWVMRYLVLRISMGTIDECCGKSELNKTIFPVAVMFYDVASAA